MSDVINAALNYDLFVIGGGSGGVRASRVAAAYARVAIAEEHRIGRTCVIRGCVPKKLLVYGSHFAKELQEAGHYGWTISILHTTARCCAAGLPFIWR